MSGCILNALDNRSPVIFADLLTSTHIAVTVLGLGNSSSNDPQLVFRDADITI